MQRYKTLDEIDSKYDYSILIGNFDGVHKGHQSIIKTVLEDAKKNSLELLLITFVPHPKVILLSENTHTLINSYEERADLISSFGVKHLWEIDFTRDFSSLSPQEFLENYLLLSGKTKKIFMGYDFSFGKDKKGNYDFVVENCKDKGIEVHKLSEFKSDCGQVSSSEIRKLLQEGNVEKANDFLGRVFYLQGIIKKGEGRGRKIGFPTANLEIDSQRVVPRNGVYFSQSIIGDFRYNSLTNIGFNPTFNGDKTIHIETHILDFDRDIYGDTFRLEFIKLIRPEKKFPNVNDLIEQINQDKELAINFFKNVNNS